MCSSKEMVTMAKIVGILGSLRAGSYNKLLLHNATTLMPAHSELVVWDLLAATPPFSEDDEEHPTTAVQALRAAITDAAGVLVVTPEYNASIPGQLKNALDWASRPFPANVLRGKAVAVIGASPSPGGAERAQAETRIVLRRIGAHVLDRGVSVPHAHRQFTAEGSLVNPVLRGALTELLAALVTEAAKPAESGAAVA